MKYLNFFLALIVILLGIIAFAVLNQPHPGRYIFENQKFQPMSDQNKWYEQKYGYFIKDTATGKIYEWVSFLPDKNTLTFEHRLIIIDPVNNYIQSVDQRDISK